MHYQEPQQGTPKKRRPITARRFLDVRIRWYMLVIVCVMILLMGWVLSRQYDEGIARMRAIVDEADDLVFEKERDILRMAEQVRLAQTDQFIANEARTKYGYLFPGEIRFVVQNPEVLGLPTRAPEASPPPQTPDAP